MYRVYLPKWCKNSDLMCNECSDFTTCDIKITKLFNRLLISNDSPTNNATTIAIYYGYCQKLAKYFMSFPDTWPIRIVQHNFYDKTTGKGSEAEIQRILVDLIDHGDPSAPTDFVHELRLKLCLYAQKLKKGYIVKGDLDIEVNISDEEETLLGLLIQNWRTGQQTNTLTFEKTKNLNRCRYCFISDCEHL